MKEHAVKHFEEEEAYMESIGYEDLEMHRRLHRGFREETLPELEQELIRTDYAPDTVDHFLGVCVGWLIGHTYRRQGHNWREDEQMGEAFARGRA